jgi:hypothetical protein
LITSKIKNLKKDNNKIILEEIIQNYLKFEIHIENQKVFITMDDDDGSYKVQKSIEELTCTELKRLNNVLDLSKKTLNELVNEKLNNMKDQLIELNNTLLYKKQLYFFKYYMKLNKEDIDYLFDTEVKETTNAELKSKCKILFIKMKIIDILSNDSAEVRTRIHTSMGTSEFFKTAVEELGIPWSDFKNSKEFDSGVPGARDMYANFLLLKEMKANKNNNFLDKIIDFIKIAPDNDKKNLERDLKNEEKFKIFDKIDLIKERTILNTDPNPKELKISELTSGEQVILLSILWKYQVEKLFPSSTKKLILLLDEPDSFLHPNAIKNFIEQLKKVIEENSSVQIILTSHNPGTFSLMDDECIFYLDLDDKDKKIKSCEEEPNSKTMLLKGITDNLFFVLKPFKLVLIEGAGDDYLFYQYLYHQKDKLCKSNIPVIFRSGGDCMIKNIVKNDFIKKEGDEQEFYNYMYVITDGDDYINTTEAIEYYEKDLKSTKQKIQEKIDKEIEHDKKGHLFRLKKIIYVIL